MSVQAHPRALCDRRRRSLQHRERRCRTEDSHCFRHKNGSPPILAVSPPLTWRAPPRGAPAGPPPRALRRKARQESHRPRMQWEPHGRDSVLAARAVDATGKGSALAARAVGNTQGKGRFVTAHIELPLPECPSGHLSTCGAHIAKRWKVVNDRERSMKTQ